MSQVVTIIRDFGLSQNTVVEWEKGRSVEYVVARNIHIINRPLIGRLHTGERVECTWGSGTYFNDKDEAMRCALDRERDALETLEQIYALPLEPGEPTEPCEEDIDMDYLSNAPCDNAGFCVGTSCSKYWDCNPTTDNDPTQEEGSYHTPWGGTCK